VKQEVAAVTRMAMCPVTSGRVAHWAWSAQRRLGHTLRTHGITAVDHLPPPPTAGAPHRTTVSAVLKLTGATCLVQAGVLQRWDSAHAQPRPLVVGVTREPDGSIAAHAWLDGDESGEDFVELHRRSPPG
jgi:hypothetical protein